MALSRAKSWHPNLSDFIGAAIECPLATHSGHCPYRSREIGREKRVVSRCATYVSLKKMLNRTGWYSDRGCRKLWRRREMVDEPHSHDLKYNDT